MTKTASRSLSFLLFTLLLAATPALADTSLVLDPAHSRVEFAAKATNGSFQGHFTTFGAEILTSRDNTWITSAELHFRFTDLKTGNADRDAHLLQWVENGKFPDAIYTLKKLVKDPIQPIAVGSLTMHGLSQTIMANVKFTRNGDRYIIDGSTLLNYSDWDLKTPRRYKVISVDPEFTVHFHLEATLPPSAG